MTTTDKNNIADRKRRYRRMSMWTVAIIMTLAMVMPLTGYLYVGLQEVQAQSAEKGNNPRSNFWDAVRAGNSGYTAVQGQETGVLIQNGQNWRQLRNGIVTNYGGWILFAVLMSIIVFFAVKGRIRLEEGRSGVTIKRWDGFDRLIHWSTAIMFVILAVTGLSTLFGRAVLIPLMGPKGFSAWAGVATELHNYIGPLFSITVGIMILLWFKNNMFNATDRKWFTSGGGIIGKNSHPDAGFVNGGEKLWYWIILIVGGIVIASGYILDFPNWGTTRGDMQTANLIHSVAAMIWIAFWMGHAYIGTIGSEGSLEAMATGYVDENWAKQHHNLWVEELKNPPAEDEEAMEDETVIKEQPA